jgi:hypothetical protein
MKPALPQNLHAGLLPAVVAVLALVQAAFNLERLFTPLGPYLNPSFIYAFPPKEDVSYTGFQASV